MLLRSVSRSCPWLASPSLGSISTKRWRSSTFVHRDGGFFASLREHRLKIALLQVVDVHCHCSRRVLQVWISLLGPSWLTVWLFSVTGSQGLVMVALSSSEPGTSAVDVVVEKEKLNTHIPSSATL